MKRGDWIWIVLLTLGFEAVTCLARFGLELQSTRDTAVLAQATFGVRIHHGYVGALMLLGLHSPRVPERWRPWLFRIGAALVCSDLVHHFAVLWPITGSPEFDFVYPAGGD